MAAPLNRCIPLRGTAERATRIIYFSPPPLIADEMPPVRNRRELIGGGGRRWQRDALSEEIARNWRRRR